MSWEKIRSRIEKRMQEKGLNKAEISRNLGRSPGFMHDFLTGKQRRLNDDDTRQLAKMLNVSVAWILGLEAPDFSNPRAPAPSPVPLENIDAMSPSPPTDVGEAGDYTVIFSALDLISGRANVIYDGGHQCVARIVDPAVSMPGNRYAQALLHKLPLQVIAKKVAHGYGLETLVILDCKKE